MADSVKKITDNALCTACGACAGLCPVHAIQMKENPAGFLQAEVDPSACILCGKCLKICPSYSENPLFTSSEDIFHGTSVNGYVGYAADPEIRRRGQSGGVVTALLLYLLEQQAVDGAVVNVFDAETQRPKAILAKSREELLKGCGSYYSQSAVVEAILSHQEEKTAAVVLGCQAESLRLIRERLPGCSLPEYTIGLICAGQNSGRMVDDLLQMAGCPAEDEKIQYFRFRDKLCGGWPGNVHMSSPNREYSLPKERRHELKSVYESYRCLSCYDQMNIYSDIVCGDPWHIAGKDVPEGNSVVISRTEKGDRLLQDACRDGAICLEPLSVDAIFTGQTVDSRHIPKYFTVRRIHQEKDWAYPYPQEYPEDCPAISEASCRQLLHRLEYSRQYYLSENRQEADRLLTREKEQQQRIRRRRVIPNLKRKIYSLLKFIKGRNRH